MILSGMITEISSMLLCFKISFKHKLLPNGTVQLDCATYIAVYIGQDMSENCDNIGRLRRVKHNARQGMIVDDFGSMFSIQMVEIVEPSQLTDTVDVVQQVVDCLAV